MDGAERPLPAIVAGLQPMRAVGFLPLHLHLFGTAAKPVAADFGGIHIRDGQRRVRGGGAAGVAPILRPGDIGAAIDDQPVAPDRHFHRQRAGMGEPVDAGRRRNAAIDDQHAPAGLHPLKAAFGHRRRAAPAPAGLGQRQVYQGGKFLPRTVEQRQPAIAVAQHAQRRRHPLNGGRQHNRRLGLGRLQQRADFGQVLQRRQMRRRAPLHMAAVAQHLPADFRRQEAQRPGQERGVLRQRNRGCDQTLQRGQRPRVLFLRREGRSERTGITDQARHQLLAKQIIGGGREEIVMAEPGGNPGADHIGPVDRRFVGRRRNPFRHQGTGPQPGIVGAKRAQIAQPGEAMRGGAQRGGGGKLVPPARPQQANRAAVFQLALQQPRAANRIAGPGVAHRQRRRIGHTGHAQRHPQRHANIRQPGDRLAGTAQPASGNSGGHVRR